MTATIRRKARKSFTFNGRQVTIVSRQVDTAVYTPRRDGSYVLTNPAERSAQNVDTRVYVTTSTYLVSGLPGNDRYIVSQRIDGAESSVLAFLATDHLPRVSLRFSANGETATLRRTY
jgi:type IV secretory pathway protease TraF